MDLQLEQIGDALIKLFDIVNTCVRAVFVASGAWLVGSWVFYGLGMLIFGTGDASV